MQECRDLRDPAMRVYVAAGRQHHDRARVDFKSCLYQLILTPWQRIGAIKAFAFGG